MTCASMALSAQTVTFRLDTASWDNTATWDPAVVPTQNDSVFFPAHGTISRAVITGTAGGGFAYAGSITSNNTTNIRGEISDPDHQDVLILTGSVEWPALTINATTTLSNQLFVKLLNSSSFNLNAPLILEGTSSLFAGATSTDLSLTGTGTFSVKSSQIAGQNTLVTTSYDFDTISLSQALLSLDAASLLRSNSLTITSGQLISSGNIESSSFILNSGTAVNNGSMSFNTTKILGGALSGSGVLLLKGTSNLLAPIEQSYVNINPSKSTTPSTQTSLLSGSLNLQNGILYTSGTIEGDIIVQASAVISPAFQDDAFNSLSPATPAVAYLKGSLTLNSGAQALFYIRDANYSQFIVDDNSNVIFSSGTPSVISIDSNITPIKGQVYKLIDFQNLGASLETTLSAISGTPSVLSNIQGADFTLVPGPSYLGVAATYNSFLSQVTTPNQQVVANTLMSLNGATSPCLQEKINVLVGVTSPQITQETLNVMTPSAFKGQQFILEEMTFIVNDEISNQTNSHIQGRRAFLAAGFERLSQNSFYQYAGFTSYAGYQLLGLTSGYKNWQITGAAGALETTTDYKSVTAHSSSTSVLASLAASYFKSGWTLGIDGLFGYHFLTTKRDLNLYYLKAKSNHDEYSLKAQAHLGYTKKWNHSSFSIYDEIGYLWSHENGYTEKNAECLNLKVKSSDRDLLRNTVGFKLKNLRSCYMQPYIDLAYVWEDRYKGLSYICSFVDTTQEMNIQGLIPTKNYGKGQLGVEGSSDKWSYRVNSQAMVGKHFWEIGLNAYVARKF